jgi:hypothetical protein
MRKNLHLIGPSRDAAFLAGPQGLCAIRPQTISIAMLGQRFGRRP